MSSVKQVKLEIKPAAKKASSNKSIGRVASKAVKHDSHNAVTNPVLFTSREKTLHTGVNTECQPKQVKTGIVKKCESVKLSDGNHSGISDGNILSTYRNNISVKEVKEKIEVTSTDKSTNTRINDCNVESIKDRKQGNETEGIVIPSVNQFANSNSIIPNATKPNTDSNYRPCTVNQKRNEVRNVALNAQSDFSYSKVSETNTGELVTTVGNNSRNHGATDIHVPCDHSTAKLIQNNISSLPSLNNKAISTQIDFDRKISNQERKNMFSQGMKDELLKKRNDMLAGPNIKTMDQEKHIDLEEEPPDNNNSLDATVDDKIVPAPANMIDELQKYLLKRFGPIETTNLKEEHESAKFKTKTDDDTNDKSDISQETKSEHIIPPKSPTSPAPFIPHPIFFKTSIKNDPGSALHDQLLKELGSVLKKKTNKSEGDKENDTKTDDSEKRDGLKLPKRRVSAKGNKVLGNKLLLANLENQLQRTLNRNKIFQRQKLKVVDLETIEVAETDVSTSQETLSNISKKSVEAKNDNEITHDLEDFHKGDDNVISAMNELDQTINAHSEYTSEPTDKPNNDSESEINVSLEESKSVSDISNESKELYVVAFKNPSGITQGVVCSVERRKSTRDSCGKPRKYLTCINIVGEKATEFVEDCPFTQDIADAGLPTASGAGLFFGEEDKAAHFNVDVGRRKGDLRVSVSGPNSIAKCSVDPQADGSYTVTYIPVETGLFDIRVTWNDRDIPGSPYHPKVVDARKVRIIGGWQHFCDSNERVNLVVGEKKQLPFDVSEAGPGTFTAEVKGPSNNVDVDIDTHTIGRAVVEFVPQEEGTHYIHLFWSDIPLVNSPFLGFAIQQTPDASKLILTGRGLKEAVVREEAEFIIDGSQAGRGNPDVVLSGVRAEVNVKVTPIGNGKFRCVYFPILPGAYLLHITWNGRQLRGSPYKVNVIGAFYPNKVVVSGVGGAILGREMNVGIDTRKAGPGELTAYCMGPHRVAYCELEDNHDGTFRLAIKPNESGRHVLQIKYGGEHVQGSPFVYKVTEQPDAGKVRVSGPGVEHGILATYLSRFIVETRGAGAGQLTVRIRGPKGAFQVEMYRDSQRDRTILCKFDPSECGLYIISVKWSGEDVPGSPFHVHILDTQDELEQVLRDASYSFAPTQSRSTHGGSHLSYNTPRMVYGQWRDQI